MPYSKDKPDLPETADQLRARIPGWGRDLDPRDRPSFPRERFDPQATGAHWDVPEPQPDAGPRERSVEHPSLTAVFGTAQPLHGLSGRIRRLAYERYSEGRLAHWLLLMAGDRVDAAGARLRSYASRRPDNLLTESGVVGRRGGPGIEAVGEHPADAAHRVDTGHRRLDPVVAAGPAALRLAVVGVGAGAVVRRVRRRTG